MDANALEPTVARSRRAVLAAAFGGAAALLGSALGHPSSARAAAGDPLVLGQTNSSGTAQTTLSNAGLGAAFTLRSTNTATNATGIFGWNSSTGPGATRGVYGRADGDNSYGVYARSTSVAGGTGAAIYADGGANHSIVAHAATSSGVAILAENTAAAAENNATPAIRAFSAGATFADISATNIPPAAIESAGQSGLTGVSTDPSGGNGVAGAAIGTSGLGLFGLAMHETGSNFGVIGETYSTGGIGVYGISQFATGVAGWSDSGIGVRAESTTGTGLTTSSQTLALHVEGRTLLNGFADLAETGEPSTPAATLARLFVRDADGTLQLCVKFPDGTLVVLAGEGA